MKGRLKKDPDICTKSFRMAEQHNYLDRRDIISDESCSHSDSYVNQLKFAIVAGSVPDKLLDDNFNDLGR